MQCLLIGSNMVCSQFVFTRRLYLCLAGLRFFSFFEKSASDDTI